MLISIRGARLVLLSAMLSLGGCFFDSDDDDVDTDEGTGAVVDVDVDDDVAACRTECDNEHTQCGLSCSDNTCVGGCDTDRQECFTDCD